MTWSLPHSRVAGLGFDRGGERYNVTWEQMMMRDFTICGVDGTLVGVRRTSKAAVRQDNGLSCCKI